MKHAVDLWNDWQCVGVQYCSYACETFPIRYSEIYQELPAQFECIEEIPFNAA